MANQRYRRLKTSHFFDFWWKTASYNFWVPWMLKSPLTSFLKLHRSLILLRLASQISLIWSISKDENSLNRDLHGANTFKLYCITSFSRDVSLNLCFRIIKCFVKPDSREKNLVQKNFEPILLDVKHLK